MKDVYEDEFVHTYQRSYYISLVLKYFIQKKRIGRINLLVGDQNNVCSSGIYRTDIFILDAVECLI